MIRPKALNKIGISCLVIFALVAVLATPSAATIIRFGDGSGNITAPGDDPGWANVGARAAASAVYLSDRWVLTAAHVGVGGVTFGGTFYPMESGSWVLLHDPDDPGKAADLGLFRITSTPPGVANLSMVESAPDDGSEVLGIGNGLNREAAETWWDSSWNKETGTEAYRGFELLLTKTKRWGKNHIEASGEKIDTSKEGVDYTTYALKMRFDQSGGAGGDEMQAVEGDSGGALFYKNGSNWELAGILISRGTYQGQPSDAAVYGNDSYAADLSEYRSQIVAIVPEPSALAMLLGLGVVCLVWHGRRRASRAGGR